MCLHVGMFFVYYITSLFFLDSTYKWWQVLSLTYFTKHNTFHIHPCCCKWQNFIFFYGRIVLHCAFVCVHTKYTHTYIHIYVCVYILYIYRSFPSGSDSKESACSERDSSLIHGSGRSPGEGIFWSGYPLQYSCLENSTEKPGGLQSTGSQRVTHCTSLLSVHLLMDTWSACILWLL